MSRAGVGAGSVDSAVSSEPAPASWHLGGPGLRQGMGSRIVLASVKITRNVTRSSGARVGTTMQAHEVTAWFAASALVVMLVAGGLSVLWFNGIP